MAARPRRRRRLADLFGRGSDPLAAVRVQLAPRRLEPRRMLDAAAPALALEMADLSSEYVQASDDFAPQEFLATETTAAASANSPPANIQIQPLAAIDENGVATLELIFEDADQLDAHTVEVDWGDGAVEVFNVSPGSQFFATTHQYLDDDPSVTSSDIYQVGVKVTDAAGDFTTAAAPLTVNNVAPSNLQIAPMAPILENGVATLELTFDDPGALDTHTVEVDWGDGNVEVFNVSQGSSFFSTTHQYLDDNPTATAADDYTVNVRVLDDDGGEVTGSTTVNVSNVPPTNLQLAPIADVDENGFAQLNLTFTDPGTLDTHQVEVDWGDGAIEVLNVTPGARAFSTTHQYLDDNPSVTSSDQYAVNVRLLDDDLGEIAAAPAAVTVHNVAPSGVVIDPLAPIDELGFAVLNLTFTDPGALDSHTVEIDWGDGAVETLPVIPGARAFTASHQYLDDNPTATPSDVYTITVKVRDDDGGVAAAATSVVVNNLAPSVLLVPTVLDTVEGQPQTALLVATDVGALDTLTYEIDWGDGHVTSGAVAGILPVSHIYADNGVYTVKATVTDDDGGQNTHTIQITIANVAPTLNVVDHQTVNEGSLLSLANIGTFTDPGFDNPLNTLDPSNGGETTETFTYTIHWGDGTTVGAGAATIDAPGAEGVLTSGSFDGSHTYADNGVYTVTVTVFDDDGGQSSASFQVTVMNVAPTLTVVSDQTVNEGSLLSLVNIGQFTDPGFNNPLNTLDPSNGGETAETFTYAIHWGDGTLNSVGPATIDSPGGAGVPTSGSFDGSHTYADNGVYSVTVTVFDDDGGEHSATFQVTVLNVAPTLSVVGNQAVDEGSLLSLSDIGLFTDPGFNNTLNPILGGETEETFTYSINWGDGTTTDAGAAAIDTLGGVGVPTAGSFDGSHTYADNGVYTVTVTVFDDDGGQHAGAFQVTVSNVAPTLTVVANQTVNEGSTLSLTNIGSFTDPGFNNPLNPLPGGEISETFTFTINWGDGTTTAAGAATIDMLGGVGAPTAGSFDGSHTYADNGVYTVTVTVFDDDGGQHQRTFQVTVQNVAPTLTVVANQTLNEGSLLSLANIGAFTDPGFNNPLNVLDAANGGETTETFTFTINWGDGTATAAGAATIDMFGGVGAPTAGSFDGSHTYADNGVYTVTVTVFDDDAGQHSLSFTVTVLNVDPTLTGSTPTVDEGDIITLQGLGIGLSDPGFDNPLNAGNAASGGEFEEAFTGVTIDWGDGTATVPVSIVNRVSGSPGVLTTAQFDHAAHAYADNGVYTVTVQLSDDDGPVVARTFTIVVENVAPALTVAPTQSIHEGSPLVIVNIGQLTDPGFNNPLNAGSGEGGGETEETFTYTINWGDEPNFLPGDDPFEEDGVPTTDLFGSQGVLTAASFDAVHTYVDNGVYTVTVTVSDDDGGVTVKTFEVAVKNVSPSLDDPTFLALDLNKDGETTITGMFTDPGRDAYVLFVDWGDNAGPNEEAFLIVTPSQASSGVHTFTAKHTYTEPPDPLHPTALIPIKVRIHDDDFPFPQSQPVTVDETGESNAVERALKNPGIGNQTFRIDTTPQVALLTFPERAVAQVDVTTSEIRAAVAAANDEGGSSGDTRAAGEQYLELRVINPDGSFSEGYRLRPEVLGNLQALFRKLPDNHYAIYLVQPETNLRRLVIEVFVRNGKVIDPGDDSEGARDRPPTDESTTKPNPAVERALEQVQGDDGANDPTTAIEPAQPQLEQPYRLGSSSAVYHRTALASVALALSGAGRDWRRQLEQAIASARPGQWKRLKTAGHRRTKPR